MNQAPNAPAPFSCSYTPNVPELLTQLNCSLAVSTYQAGKLIFLSPKEDETLIQLPRNFQKPMGFTIDERKNRMALALKDEVIEFANSTELAKFYPKSPDTYDALFLPRTTHHTGPLDFHDLAYGEGNELYAVNTLFSCIVKLDAQYNFTPWWQPNFIDQMVSEDRCHLNGMAMENSKPAYATAFGEGNTPQSWRETLLESGVLFDLASNEVMTRGLAMPHSPRIFDGQLYTLLSATGELVRIDRSNGNTEVICKIEGFVRGMAKRGDYLFIGLSKLRKNSSTFAKLNMAHKANEAGIEIVHLPTGSRAGRIIYQSSVDEIYDVHVLANSLRPNILNTLNDNHKAGLMIPGKTYWAKPKPSS